MFLNIIYYLENIFSKMNLCKLMKLILNYVMSNPIGGIFEEGDNTTVDSFLHAIRRSAIHDAVHLDPVILFIKPGDSFAAEKAGLFLKFYSNASK